MKWYGLFCGDALIKVISYGHTSKPCKFDFNVPVRENDTRYTIKEVEISIKTPN